MTDTLEQVKREFGRQAVILTTRTTTQGGVFGLGGKPCVEITAARDLADLPSDLQRGSVAFRSERPNDADGAARSVSPIAETRPEDAPPNQALMAEIGELKSLLHDLVRTGKRDRFAELPPAVYTTYLQLARSAVVEGLAGELIDGVCRALSTEQLHDPQAVRAVLAKAIESRLPTAGPIKLVCRKSPTVVALIGPTGVGKTTTIAKLAANFALREGRKVGLITIDTYRIAAVEQLRTYAEIINVPLEVVSTPRELTDAVVRQANCELILIDTAGRGQRDQQKMSELHEFFKVLPPDEIHLVLSGAADPAVLGEAMDRFRPLGIHRVIFTKLDEAVGFGAILASLQKVQVSLSYVTTGQNVPDDIRVGERKALTRLILGERKGLEDAA